MKYNNYFSYGDYILDFDEKSLILSLFYKKKLILESTVDGGLYKNSKLICAVDSLPTPTLTYKNGAYENNMLFSIDFKVDDLALSLWVWLGYKGGLKLNLDAPKGYTLPLKTTVFLNDFEISDVFPVCTNRKATDFRSAMGSAYTTVENALYNRKNDSALIFNTKKSLDFIADSNKNTYTVKAKITPAAPLQMLVEEKILSDKYGIEFSPINRNTSLPLPPSGWMTWYAVKFDASEEKVLKNAKWQAENLKDFGANTIWVDWEWYHDSLKGVRTDGVNSLKCDPVRYPNGMKHVADEIKKMGLIPAVWIGYTNEPESNEFIEKYPDIVLAHRAEWCGQYFYDFSHPDYLNKFLPAAIKQVHDWGYKAVKFDTLPIGITLHERHHADMYDPTLTTKEAFRNMVKKTRELLGDDMYMLSCSGGHTASILWASDYFEAARVGEDIFSWDNYLKNGVRKLEIFYPLHNVQFLNDPDNVVLREEFNTFEQAKSRVTLVSLLGLPMTFGDEFDVLDQDRINLIKCCLPLLDIHPLDLTTPKISDDNFLINLKINKPFTDYLVSGIFNMQDCDDRRSYSISKDFHLPKGEYLTYDFYRDEFLGIVNSKITLDFKPFECRVISLRPLTKTPQIINTTRHITGGAAEIKALESNENSIKFTSSIVKDDPYTVKIYMPDGYKLVSQNGFEKAQQMGNILELNLTPTETKDYTFEVYVDR